MICTRLLAGIHPAGPLRSSKQPNTQVVTARPGCVRLHIVILACGARSILSLAMSPASGPTRRRACSRTISLRGGPHLRLRSAGRRNFRCGVRGGSRGDFEVSDQLIEPERLRCHRSRQAGHARNQRRLHGARRDVNRTTLKPSAPRMQQSRLSLSLRAHK